MLMFSHPILPHKLRHVGIIRLVFHVFACYRLDVLHLQMYDEALVISLTSTWRIKRPTTKMWHINV